MTNVGGLLSDAAAEAANPAQTGLLQTVSSEIHPLGQGEPEELLVSPESNYFYSNVFPSELDSNNLAKYSDGENYLAYRVRVNKKPEKHLTIGPGVKIDSEALKSFGIKNIKEGEPVPISVVNRIAEQRWHKSIADSKNFIGSDNPAVLPFAEMIYQMGKTGVSGFTKTIDLLKNRKFAEAADEALKGKKGGKSAWAIQTPNRAASVTSRIKNLDGR